MHPKTRLILAIAAGATWLEGHGVNPWLAKQWQSEQKYALWKTIDRTARAHEPAFRRAARAAFEADRRAILALLQAAKIKAISHKATVDWNAFMQDVYKYLQEQSQDTWRKTFIPVIRGVVIDQGERWSVALGMQFDVQNLQARDWFNRYALKFAQEPSVTTRNAIARIAEQAQAQGWSIPQTQKQIDALFDAYQTNAQPSDPDFEWVDKRRPPYRTEMIARSETIRASNAGSIEIFRDWGVEKKEWLATQDDRTRPEHLAANGQVVGVDAAFEVGGEYLTYPGDPAGSPANTIQCRCTVLPVIE